MLEMLLEKLGVKSFDDLKPAEKETYTKWVQVLSKGDATIEDLKKFLPAELERAHEELRKLDNSEKKDMFYKAYAELCQTIIKVIVSPAKEREQLKGFLKQKYGID